MPSLTRRLNKIRHEFAEVMNLWDTMSDAERHEWVEEIGFQAQQLEDMYAKHAPVTYIPFAICIAAAFMVMCYR